MKPTRPLRSIARAMLISASVAAFASSADVTAFVGARVIDGTGKPAVEKATIIIRNGKIEAVGPSVKVPAGAQQIDAAGKTIIPGLISAHSHVNAVPDLDRFAAYGVTTVFSLGGDDELKFRDQTRAEQQKPTLTRSRLFIAGPIPTSMTPAEGRKAVDALAAAKTDIVKIRIDDTLGATKKMTPDVYTAIIDEAHKKGMRMAVHVVYLSDAKAVLKLGTEYIAHSVRDFDIDDETIAMLKKNNSFYCPTLLREVSTFVYGDNPKFLKDPFFLRDPDPAQVKKANDPQYQAEMKKDPAGKWYKEHLPVAMRNLKKAEDSGVRVVMGTDTGPPQRFQGYFEHLELEYMVNSGLTPMQTLVAATNMAANATGDGKQIGSIETGKWADLLVLNANPLDDIKNTRKIDSIWIAGNKLPGK
jgi:imidazolonepropionase-like amidohydrolase